MATLEHETRPFSAQALMQWLQQGDADSDAMIGMQEQEGSPTAAAAAAALFWDIPSSKLRLEETVAGGASGNVWRAVCVPAGLFL